ncbi:MAG: hemolysin III family protein [Bacillaceae bacterium]
MEYSLKEEIANAISHGIGALLSIPALVVLVVQGVLYGTTAHVVSFSIFGGSMFLLFLFSTLVHSITHPKVKKVFEYLDHSAIYILIAGSYTPFILLTINGPLKWFLFIFMWGLALGGIIFKLMFLEKFHFVSTIVYLIMGWLCVFFIKPVYEVLSIQGIILLVIGGLFYSVGCIFYLWRLFPFHHMVWHLFVLAGSATMYSVVLIYLV